MKEIIRKVVALLCVGSMSAAMLTGCGGSEPAPAEPAPAVEEPAAEEPAPAEEVEEVAEEEEAAPADEGSTPRNETLYFAGQQWGSINDWNPMSPNSNNAMGQTQKDTARTLIWETPFMYNSMDGKLYGLLAKEYTWNDDQTVITVKMNPDAHWSDGTPVTAEDMAYTFDTHVKYESSFGSDYANYIDSIKAVDDETVEVAAKLDGGKAINPLKVTAYLCNIYVMPKAYLEKVEERNNGDADAVKQDPMDDLIASGPYLPYVNNDQKVIFIRDENYWGQADSMWGKLPDHKYIAHTIYKDNAAGQVALQQGEVDVCQQFITDVQKLWLDEDLPISTWYDEAPYGMTATMPSMFFNCEKPGLDQPAVRKAIAMATDYEQIIASAMSGQSETFDDLPRCIAGPSASDRAYIDFDALKDLQWKNADIEGANALLDEAGIVDTDGNGVREYDGKDLTFKAECPTGWTDWNASMEIVAAAGKEIGIDISTYFPEANSFYDDMTTCNFDIIMWSAPGAGPMSPYSKAMFYFSEEYAKIASNWSGNFGHYMNDDAEAILQKIPLETDEAKLKEYYTELSKLWLEEVPSVALMYRPEQFYSVNESVWTNFPAADDGRNIPPLMCTDGYGIAALYDLELAE